MKSGELFKIKFVSFDKKRNTGGIIKEYQAKQNVKKEKKVSENLPGAAPKKNSRNPKHFKHATRSLKVYANGIETALIKKCHIDLIVEFNGKMVYL